MGGAAIHPRSLGYVPRVRADVVGVNTAQDALELQVLPELGVQDVVRQRLPFPLLRDRWRGLWGFARRLIEQKADSYDEEENPHHQPLRPFPRRRRRWTRRGDLVLVAPQDEGRRTSEA